jgi:prephenate dehydrogenase
MRKGWRSGLRNDGFVGDRFQRGPGHPLHAPGANALAGGTMRARAQTRRDYHVRELESVAAKGGAYFIGSHPMAGGEKTGVAAARADLFKNAACVLTHTRKSNAAAVRKLERFWKSLGARVLKLPPEQHDLFVSRTSHLPHVVAATLVNLVLGSSQPKGQSQLCATGFRHTTRIASGSPELWRDIALANRKHVARSIVAFISELQKFESVLKKNDEKGIEKFFETARSRRDQWRSSNVKC